MLLTFALAAPYQKETSRGGEAGEDDGADADASGSALADATIRCCWSRA